MVVICETNNYLRIKFLNGILLFNLEVKNKCTNFVITITIIIVLMEVSIVQIGNSKGLRLSKTVLDKYKIRDTVEMILEDEQIVIRASTKPRQGWDEAFKTMNANGEDQLLINDVFDDENPEEWK